MRKSASTAAAVLCVILAVCVSAARGQSVEEYQIFQLVNAERAKQRLQPLAWDGGVAGIAREHSRQMARQKFFAHQDPRGRTVVDRASAGRVRGWSKIGENVGRGGSVDSLHQAFMDSAGHRENILDPAWTHVGVGALYANDRLYVTVVFMAKGQASKPKPEPKPEPKPTTTTTTIPPTTTTTLVVGPDKPVTPGESCVSVSRQWWMCHS